MDPLRMTDGRWGPRRKQGISFTILAVTPPTLTCLILTLLFNLPHADHTLFYGCCPVLAGEKKYFTVLYNTHDLALSSKHTARYIHNLADMYRTKHTSRHRIKPQPSGQVLLVWCTIPYCKQGWARATFSVSLQSQFRNLKNVLLQLHICNS